MTTAAAALVVGSAGLASADNVKNDVTAGGNSTFVAGSSTTVNYWIQATGDPGDQGNVCNATSTPVTVSINAPAGVVATPSSVRFSDCDVKAPVVFSSSTAGSYPITVTPSNTSLFNDNPAGFTLVVSASSTPVNTPPTVSVTGFTDGAEFEIGSVPTPGCAVTDAEDTDESARPVVDTSALSHGLGVVTVTCSYTDSGGLSDGDTKTYTIVDTGDPTITHTVSPEGPDGAHDWYITAPTVTFQCSDSGSGIQSCLADDANPASASYTLGESASAQSVSGTAADWAGNTTTDSATGLRVDLNDPTVRLVGGPADGASYFYGDTPAEPTCTADDSASGVDGYCSVTGYDPSVGTHTVTASVKDKAGHDSSASATYIVNAWTLGGFYKPVDMDGVLNTVKAGSTVPLKFNVFKGSERLTSNIGATFSVRKTTCGTDAATDAVEEFLTTGSTSLRYDSTSQQWIQNWATPRNGASGCYRVTMTTADGSSTWADFKLK